MSIIGTISFINNTAIEFGGALSLADYVELDISDVTFYKNKAEFGGAVSLTSAAWATANFSRCLFEGNQATSGGALDSSGKGLAILQRSSFWLNVAGEPWLIRVSTLLGSKVNECVPLVNGISVVVNIHPSSFSCPFTKTFRFRGDYPTPVH